MRNDNVESWEVANFTVKKNYPYLLGRRIYRKFFGDKLHSKPLQVCRLRLIFTAWGYWPLLFLKNTSLIDRLKLIGRLLRVDWNVIHGHRPIEIAIICKTMSDEGLAGKGEVFVEAGCWKGGSSAKFSIICKEFGYQLHIYDSFMGVEQMSPDQLIETVNFSGHYAATMETVEQNIWMYGDASVCHLHPGWFIDTLATNPIRLPVKYVFLDCDLAKGTEEVLRGTLPSLVTNGVIFTQDYHITPVRELLHNPKTWQHLGKPKPIIIYEAHNLASIRFKQFEIAGNMIL